MAKISHMAKSRVNTNDHTGVTAAGHMTDWELANVSLLYPLSIPSRIFSIWPQIIILVPFMTHSTKHSFFRDYQLVFERNP